MVLLSPIDMYVLKEVVLITKGFTLPYLSKLNRMNCEEDNEAKSFLPTRSLKLGIVWKQKCIISTLSLIHHFETVPNSNKLLSTTDTWLLTLSQTSCGFYMSGVQVF